MASVTASSPNRRPFVTCPRYRDPLPMKLPSLFAVGRLLACGLFPSCFAFAQPAALGAYFGITRDL